MVLWIFGLVNLLIRYHQLGNIDASNTGSIYVAFFLYQEVSKAFLHSTCISAGFMLI